VLYAAFAVVDTVDTVFEIALVVSVVNAVICTVESGNVNVPSLLKFHCEKIAPPEFACIITSVFAYTVDTPVA